MEVPQKPYANITKSFVHLAAQICFMKNCWNPLSMSAATGACTRHYHPTLSIWLSVDPMSDKYPGVSPYAYCGNNPIKYIDPDGKEKLIWLNQKKDKTIISGAEKYKDDGAIHIFAHGSPKSITVTIDGKKQKVETPQQLEKLLSE